MQAVKVQVAPFLWPFWFWMIFWAFGPAQVFSSFLNQVFKQLCKFDSFPGGLGVFICKSWGPSSKWNLCCPPMFWQTANQHMTWGVWESVWLPQGPGDHGDLGLLGNQPGMVWLVYDHHYIELVTSRNL